MLAATDLAEKVTAEAAPETVLLGISVTDPDAQEAQRLAQAFSVQLANLVAELETPRGNANPALKATIVDSASLPRDPVSPQPLRNLALAAVLGLLPRPRHRRGARTARTHPSSPPTTSPRPPTPP